ncbi:glycerol-3-phosphate responsive antiterminator, partial [Bacillus sp. WP8]|uniref:glycerol-3-phosphate responsive antiterminator n=1 Tax=Bacillus sp. WP8 TaxID=756828 RepID=UPI0037BE76D2
MNQFHQFLKTPFTYPLLLHLHLPPLNPIINHPNPHHKKIFLHLHLIHPIKHHHYPTQFISHQINPPPIISTTSSLILKPKQKNLYPIHPIFL